MRIDWGEEAFRWCGCATLPGLLPGPCRAGDRASPAGRATAEGGLTVCRERWKPETHGQLADMRDRLIGNLGERIEGGDLALLAAVNGAMSAIEAADRVLPDAEQAARAVVVDAPGELIAVVLYAEAEAVASIALSPIRALGLAAKLIEAALPRLGEGGRC